MFRRRDRISLQQRKRLNKKDKGGESCFYPGISDTCGSCFGGIYDVQAGSSQP